MEAMVSSCSGLSTRDIMAISVSNWGVRHSHRSRSMSRPELATTSARVSRAWWVAVWT